MIVESNNFNENLAILSNGIYIQGALNVKSMNNKFIDNSIPISEQYENEIYWTA